VTMHAFLPRTNAYIQRSMSRNVYERKCEDDLRDTLLSPPGTGAALRARDIAVA
jgi:hypothetical protein